MRELARFFTVLVWSVLGRRSSLLSRYFFSPRLEEAHFVGGRFKSDIDPFDKLYQRSLRICFSIVALGLVPSAQAIAQTESTGIELDYLKRVQIEERMSPLNQDVFGDSLDRMYGAVSFSPTDVSIQGNSALPVALTRVKTTADPYAHRTASGRFAIARHYGATPETNLPFGDWDLSTPRIALVYPLELTNNGQDVADVPKDLGFCNGLAAPVAYRVNLPNAGSLTFIGNTLSNGAQLSTPEGHSGTLFDYPGVFPTPDHAVFPSDSRFATKSYVRFTCESDTATGLVGHAPDGLKYYFNTLHYRAATLSAAGGIQNGGRGGPQIEASANIPRIEILTYAGRVEDRHGNWVKYEYNNKGQLTRIHSSDSRSITLSYNPNGTVHKVTSGDRVWTYNYSTWNDRPVLSSVTQPDGLSWTYSYSRPFLTTKNYLPVYCLADDHTWTMTSPHGLTGTFEFKDVRHYSAESSSHRIGCLGASGVGYVPRQRFNSYSLVAKKLARNGVIFGSWNYEYQSLPDDNYTGPSVWVDETNAEGIRTRRYYAAVPESTHPASALGRQLIAVEVYDGDELKSRQELQLSYEVSLGTSFLNQASITTPVHVVEAVRTQDGESYTTKYTYNSDQTSENYSFGNPTLLTETSTLGSGTRRTETTHNHNTGKWILGLPLTVTRNGKLFDRYTYNAKGQVIDHDRFGANHLTRTYHADGTLRTVTDALNRTVTLDSWYRGVPQSVTRQDGKLLSRGVNAFGQVTSFTDAKNLTTSYTYDTAGWLTSIDRPGYLATTNISYSGRGSGAMRQTATTGGLREVTNYDAFLRPTLEERTSLAGGGGSIYTRTRYDALGRVTFASLPYASTNTPHGIETSYDALGRVIETRETANNGVTATAYLANNEIRVTDPEGHVTTTRRSGYGSPDDGNPIRIAQPEGMTTTMTYDIYGNLKTASQGGLTQRWSYDDRLRLCRHYTPETNATIYAYNNANQMTAFQQGVNGTTGCATPSGNTRVSHAYDVMGRLKTVDYGDSTPDVALQYDANGNLTRNARGGAVWTYAYDGVDALSEEKLVIDGRTYRSGYAYNANGYMTSDTNPSGSTFHFAPNGLGQPTIVQAGSVQYASAATYHPNGGVKRVNLGNGRFFETVLNTRQQISDYHYWWGFRWDLSYDKNGRVTRIDDRFDHSRDRDYTYDGLGRLKTASGEWGTGSYTYDNRNNLTRKTLGSRTVSLSYNSAGRLGSYTDNTAPNKSYTYDTRGNVTSDSQHNFVYDRANQPTAISGAANGSFVYDGNFKRVKQVINGETIYSVYNIAGQLIYRDNATQNDRTDYIRLGGQTIATRTNGVTTYLYLDHLGTPIMGAKTEFRDWSERYTPFGEKWQAAAANDNGPGFTGHIADTATGLTYMQARYYDPVIGRFLSADPVGFAEGGPAYFNRYAYTANNPINFWDPDGRDRTPVGDFFRGVRGVGDAYGYLALHAANRAGSPEQRARASRIEGAIGIGFQIARNNPLEAAEAFGTALNNQGLAFFGGRVAANSAITYYGVRRLGGKSNASKTVAALGISGVNLTATQAGSVLGGFYKLDGQLQDAGLDLGSLSGQAVSDLVGPLAAGTSVNFDQESGTVSLETKVSVTGSRIKRTVTTEVCTFGDDGTCS